MINPVLFHKLRAAFGKVIVEAENQKPKLKLLDPPKQIGNRLVDWQFNEDDCCRGETFRINCPICGDSNGFHCYISALSFTRPEIHGQQLSKAGLIIHCFRRNCFKNNPEARLAVSEAIRSEAISDITICESEESLFDSDSAVDMHGTTLEDFKKWQPDYHPIDISTPIDVLKFLVKRGISARDIVELNIGYGKCWNYKKQHYIGNENWIQFPIVDQAGLRGFQSRQIHSDAKMKYFFDARTPKKMCLYNRERACKYNIVTISEGVIDAIHVGPCGMAYFGTEPSTAQKRLIQQDGAKLVLYLPDQKKHYDKDGKCDLDPGKIADKVIEEWKAKFNFEWGIYKVDVPGPDPGECTREEIWKAVLQQVKLKNDILQDALQEHAERMINYV